MKKTIILEDSYYDRDNIVELVELLSDMRRNGAEKIIVTMEAEE